MSKNQVSEEYKSIGSSNENDLGYGQLLAKLWHRRFWFLGVFTGVMAISTPLAFSKKPIYQSYMQILVEPNYQKVLEGNSSNEYLEREFADSNLEVDYATQLRVFKSAKILNKVAKKIVENSSSSENSDDKINYITASLKDSLSVSQVLEDDGKTTTKIIQASYIGGDPARTKKNLETIKEVYLEYNLEQQEKRLRDGLKFINTQIPQARLELQEAESAVTQLSKQHNLVSPEDDANAIKNNIREIVSQRNELKAQKSQTQGNYFSLQEELGLSAENSIALSRLSQSSRYQNLLNKIQETEINLAAERQKFTDDNPIIQNLLDLRDSQKALLIDEAEKILGEIPSNFALDLELLTKQRQLAGSDTNFIDRITESQSDLVGIRERDLSLAQTEANLRQQLTEFPELISQYKNLTQETEVKRGALQRLLEARQELEIELSRGGFNWQVIEPARLGSQIAPNLQKDLLLNLVVASFLGLTAAFLRETMDGRINNIQEIESQTPLPVLGTTPKLSLSQGFLGQIPFLLPKFKRSNSIKEVIEWQPFQEALNIVYENIKSSNLAMKSLAITSSIAEEGKSTFILGLAGTAVRQQQRVLVIDADLRCPSLHKAFDSPNENGLSNYLASNAEHPAIEKVSLMGETIDLITSGSECPDPVKLISSAKLKYLIEQQKQNYDLILIDTPPVVGIVDAVKIAAISDNSLLVSCLNKVTISEFFEALACLNNSKVLGVVVNKSAKVFRQYKSKPQYLLSQHI